MNNTPVRAPRSVAIIPARGGSKRLPRKNVYPFFGKPLIAWSIAAAQRSKLIEQVYVSTDDKEISEVAEELGCYVIPRPAKLGEDNVPKMVVIRHAAQWIETNMRIRPRYYVSLQANSPEIHGRDIDKAIKLLKERKLWEVISVNPDGVQNAAIRVIRASALNNTFLSAHIGVIQTNYVDVHTLEDIAVLQQRYGSMEKFEAVRF